MSGGIVCRMVGVVPLLVVVILSALERGCAIDRGDDSEFWLYGCSHLVL